MQRASIGTLAVLSLFILTTCTGLGKGEDYDGSYAGTLQGVPAGGIAIEISGSNISGTISITDTGRFRGKGEAPHSTFTGTLSGLEVYIEAALDLEIDIAVPPDPPDWQDISTTLVLTGRFNKSNVLIGNYVGANPANPDAPFIGSWSVVKGSGIASGITKPD